MATSGDEYQRDEDRLPWLETVDEDYQEGPSALRILLMVLIGLGAIAGAVYGYYYYQQHKGMQPGTGALIAAQEGDYKVKPDKPGGMKVAGEGETALATSAGEAVGNASIDLKAVPETPVTGTQAAAANAGAQGKSVAIPASGGQLKVAAPTTAPKASAGAAGGAVVQLGSYPSEAAANEAWSAKAKRFSYLAGLGKSVQSAAVNGKTMYRLRVNTGSTGQASELCGKLKVAGEACFVPAS
ncbi:hypothetical protein BH09PSE4_BH09PSE4_09580 [soil metagenome]